MKSGTWTDLGEVMHSREDKDDFNAIDPDLVDDNGLKLSFGSYGAGIFQIDIGPDINKASSSTPGNHLSGGNGRPAEGGITFKPDESPYWFHLFSEGVTPLKGSKSARPSAGKEYKVLVGRAENSTGPFVGKLGHPLTEDRDPATGSLVLGSHDNVYAPGGQSLFKDPVSGRYVMCYHYVPANASLGSPSYLGLNYVDFSSGWPVIVD
ncbi:hypothetical protein V5O48_013971 [Marasmius crinis-equi]|uniref:Uncharacterized protein n=1 Tax=Marasmius crinis-equi TaxID=585013 RepID=A0ABR3EYL0_9AGAR